MTQLALAAQTQPDLTAILTRLDKLEQENRLLAAEVRSLRARLDGTPDSESNGASEIAPAAAPASIEQRLGIQERRVEEHAETKLESSQRFPVRLTGMLLFNAYMNSRQNGGSDYPVAAAPTGDARAGATLRQTVLGLEFRGPTTFLGGKISSHIFMDFFAGANNSAIRLRTASVELAWKSRSFMAGLEKPIFNPREPNSLAMVGISPLTGAGNLWLWLPQARFQQDIHFSSRTGVRAQIGVLQTREVNPYPGSPFNGPLEASRPAVQGRYEFFHTLDDHRRIEIAPGFHRSTTHVAGQSVTSSLASFDWFFNPARRVEFTGAFYKGRNVAPLGNGIQQGYTVYGNVARPVHSIGGWSQMTIRVAPRIDVHLLTGQQDDSDDDLRDGRIGKNLLYGGNIFFRLAPNVLLGLETTQVRTMYIGQGVRINNHYDMALAYQF